jgi:hypothetical protein
MEGTLVCAPLCKNGATAERMVSSSESLHQCMPGTRLFVRIYTTWLMYEYTYVRIVFLLMYVYACVVFVLMFCF